MVETAEEKGFSNPIRPQIHIIMASFYREVDSLPNRGICYAHPVFFFCFVCIVQCNKRLVFPFPNIGAIGSTLCFTGIQKRSVKVCLTGLHSEIRKGFHNNMPTHQIYIYDAGYPKSVHLPSLRQQLPTAGQARCLIFGRWAPGTRLLACGCTPNHTYIVGGLADRQYGRPPRQGRATNAQALRVNPIQYFRTHPTDLPLWDGPRALP